MNKTLPKVFSVLTILMLVFAALPVRNAQAAAGPLMGGYSQNFNGLSSTTGTLTWTNDLTISGWYSNRTTYLASTGTSTTGSLYSFGTAAGDRALGSIASNGTGTILHGVRLVNDTGGAVTQLNVSFTGEQWRSAGSSSATPSVAQTLDFQYQVGATSLTTGIWLDFNSLDFTTPIFGTTAASLLDGNNAANRAALSASITGLSINPGQEVWLRWQDVNDANNDHALAVDDLSVTAVTGPVVPNMTISDVSLNEGNAGTTSFDFTVNLSSAAGTGGVTFDIATADGTAQDDTPPAEDNDYAANSQASQTIPAGSFTYSFSVQVNGDIVTEVNENFLVNVTNVTGAVVMDAQGEGTIVNDDAADAAPNVASTFPANGATNFPVGSNLTVTFTEPVNVTSSWFSLVCSTSGTVATTFSGGPTTFTLDPGLTLVHGETCTLTVLANQVNDQDGNDPPDNMVFNFVVGFTAYDACSDYTPIYAIQGSGLSAAITGTVSTKGVVVGDFEGSAAASGFYIQDLTGDGSSATSDGIFVYTGANNFVGLGQVVRVSGFARERFPNPLTGFGQTSLNGSDSNTAVVPAANIINCGTGSVPATQVLLPVTSIDDFERYEGMYVRFPQSLVIAEYFNYDRFGEIVLAWPLAGETRPFSGTAIDAPGAPANARTDLNNRSRITLDDVQSATNPSTLRHPNGSAFSLANKFRGGDTVQNAIGVLGFDFSLYRILPTGSATYVAANPRPASPEPVGGTIRVAAMNTLNFFVTADYPSGVLDNKCGPANNVECRGWDSDQATEFTRQRDKLLLALSGLNADIIGLNELENSTGVEPLASITSGMPGYNYIATGTIGTDAIKVGMIYRPAVVTPVGDFKLLTSAVDPRFVDTRSRPAMAQTFEVNATGARFTVVVNHFKSKGDSGLASTSPASVCMDTNPANDIPDCDQGDGQGYWNYTRTQAALALVDWLATDPTGSGDPDFIIMGDLNSYAKEDPITEITNAGYTNLIDHFQGDYAYSYTFDGQAGYLDHALANASLFAQITGAADWHINSDEPDVLDYDTSFKPAAQDALYEVNAYRTSDHDPVVVGLVPNAAPTDVNAGGPYSVDEGSSVTLTATGSDPNGDSLTYTWDFDGDSQFDDASGSSVSFDASLVDGPSGPYTVSVRATDPLGLYAEASTTVSVDNVAPSVDAYFGSNSVSCGPNNGTLTVNFSDPGVADTHSAVIDWGDGNTQTVASITSGATFAHTYGSAGLYTATVTVTDDDGDSGTDTADVMVQFNTSGFLQPINSDGTSVFKFGSTIPVKIRFTDCDGSIPADLAPTIKVTVLSGTSVGLEINEPISTSAADTTGVMRFSTNQYIYNLATNPLPDSSATYLITVTIPLNGQTFTVQFSLKP